MAGTIGRLGPESRATKELEISPVCNDSNQENLNVVYATFKNANAIWHGDNGKVITGDLTDSVKGRDSTHIWLCSQYAFTETETLRKCTDFCKTEVALDENRNLNHSKCQ